MDDLIIDGHALKHGLSAEDIYAAWESPIARRQRTTPHEDQLVCIGVLPSGKLVQMVAVVKSFGTVVFHAMVPPQTSIMRELGIRR